MDDPRELVPLFTGAKAPAETSKVVKAMEKRDLMMEGDLDPETKDVRNLIDFFSFGIVISKVQPALYFLYY